MQFSFDMQSVDIKETLLIGRGFRWNTRTKYQAKIEGVHSAVVPVDDVEDEKKKCKVKKSRSDCVNLIQWFPEMCYVEKIFPSVLTFKCSVFLFGFSVLSQLFLHHTCLYKKNWCIDEM